jgi:hypothetical protein
VDWPCNRCSDRSLGLCAIRALGGSRAEKQRAQLVSRRARLMFDHAYVRYPNRPLATIGFWYLDPLQRVKFALAL